MLPSAFGGRHARRHGGGRTAAPCERARAHRLGTPRYRVRDRRLLGVHAVGAGATEMIHIGQAVMGLGGTVDSLVDMVFNYPTLAEAYQVAAPDAANKLRALALAAVWPSAPPSSTDTAHPRETPAAFHPTYGWQRERPAGGPPGTEGCRQPGTSPPR